MIDPAIVDRLREAAAGFPNPIVNDTAIVRRADLRALLEALGPRSEFRTPRTTPLPGDMIYVDGGDLVRAECVRDLLDAYRAKRAVDGLNGRLWDGTVHWRAEQQIADLEKRLAERHLADAETPP